MRVVMDTRTDEILRLEHLLDGMNYTLWLNAYGPFALDRPLEAQLRHSVGKGCTVGGDSPICASDARGEIIEHLLHPGDGGYGPLDLPAKRPEVLRLVEVLLGQVRLDRADIIRRFWLAEGHPAYPVWWDFAFDIQTQGQRWILMSSASD
ncbi:hypothetical protein EON09_18380 [Pseudomonas soli]|jgi:hypothetical protein|uniref:Uncharacterized protein n=2 Tax=cellular organisms TaxID=131567 RepID=A0A2A2KCI8_9BILA|nr:MULTISPECIES: hypothetical protein [Pseudomonas]PAV71539.1 hypothetical protein WR25_08948 [Diploscapter pachys]AUY36536.1 hypothetical protein C3F42_26455 [Pseudomonas sp. PONIH3]MBC3457327.1 hypothetical protein [Pseudomonas mosselii]MDH1529710.1 hypothetical protein [Pseudomonas mosselii]MDH1656059.1 hypothetical protein [Pseudomonas mosselii]